MHYCAHTQPPMSDGLSDAVDLLGLQISLLDLPTDQLERIVNLLLLDDDYARYLNVKTEGVAVEVIQLETVVLWELRLYLSPGTDYAVLG